MGTKYYGVKKGRKLGVFQSWNECKTYVDGYPNAQYKSFGNYSDAYFFVWGKYPGNSTKKQNSEKENYDIVAYIDGSYDNALKRFSYAGIIFKNGERYEFANSDDDKKLVKLRNVAGELKAAMYVMNYARENGAKRIAIYYDYAGIENWATGAWRANTEFTEYYSSYVKEIMQVIKITFKKVKAHSGNKYNDEVDALAKKALQVSAKEEKTQNKLDRIEESNLDIINPDIFSLLKGRKKSLDFGFLIEDQLFASDDIYCKFKEMWKNEKRNLKDIKELKAYFDLNTQQFIIIVTTEKDFKIVKIESGVLNG